MLRSLHVLVNSIHKLATFAQAFRVSAGVYLVHFGLKESPLPFVHCSCFRRFCCSSNFSSLNGSDIALVSTKRSHNIEELCHGKLTFCFKPKLNNLAPVKSKENDIKQDLMVKIIQERLL